MSITVVNNVKKDTQVFPKHFVDGCAYMDDVGRIFIANRYSNIAGVSLCGNSIALADADGDEDTKYTQVNLHVTVTPL
jgi:hypothetical protein